MLFTITTATQKIRNLKKRIRGVQGGTSASKTVGIIQNLIDFAQSDITPTLTSIVSESMPHIKKGAELDFLNIMKSHNYYVEDRWNRTEHQYHFESGSITEFFSADDATKVRGPRRDRLFINECNNISFDTFDQLELRTNEFVYLDWNPVEDFWFYDEVEGKRDDVDTLILNYLDNEAIHPNIKRSLELRKNRKNWWKVYGLGQRGEIEGRIYTGWRILDDMPYEARLERFWIDFGYSNHPTSIGAIYYYNGGYILDELAYQTGFSNRQIADIIQNQEGYENVLTIADCAEPKSIDEIKSYGVLIQPSVKGKDSIVYGIKTIQDFAISITKRSVATIKEYRNYMWDTNKDGKFINVPVDLWNHSMDGIRYAITSLIHAEPTEMSSYIPEE